MLKCVVAYLYHYQIGSGGVMKYQGKGKHKLRENTTVTLRNSQGGGGGGA